jgi:hypothetical protein
MMPLSFQILLTVFLLALNTYCGAFLYYQERWVKRLGGLFAASCVAFLLTAVLQARYPATVMSHVAMPSVALFVLAALAGWRIRAYRIGKRAQIQEHPRFYTYYFKGANVFFAHALPVLMSVSQARILFS